MTLERPSARLLVVDDSADTRELLQRNLSSQGFDVLTAADVTEALKILGSTQIDLVITDLKMPGGSGLYLIRHVRENLKETEVMMITGYPSLEGAIAAVKSGAEEYLCKPFTREELLGAVTRALEKLTMRKASISNIERQTANTLGIVGESEAMHKVFKAVSRFTSLRTPVLITGENGTGKELMARAIHYSGPNANAPFITVNCTNNSEEFSEKQLFGYTTNTPGRGAEWQAGFFHFADGGTLYLKEIPELPYILQTKLFRALEEKKFHAVGSTDIRKVNFRVIADSNRDLRVLANEGTFREDLFIRLSMNAIFIPPLRERENDILLLARHFLEKYSSDMGRSVPSFSDHALEVMKSYLWPGNIAELQNFIQLLLLRLETDLIDVPDFPAPMRYSMPGATSVKRSLAELEIEHIRNVISSVGGNKSQAAEILGITRKTLREKLKQIEPQKSENKGG
jgi:DNA-binding NtrC family response regulator